MGFIKGLFNDKHTEAGTEDQYYDLKSEEAVSEDGTAKMILLEPRAYSEAQQIADHLKKRNTVVVSVKSYLVMENLQDTKLLRYFQIYLFLLPFHVLLFHVPWLSHR